ncbi:MAG: VOC family protein [Pseudomonadota bacterium]
MAHGTFIWADLSSYRPELTRPFYEQLFGWRFDGYAAQIDGLPVAGLFQMPEEFQDMGMPSFWMSYIAVDDVAATVETARAHGGKVELGPIPFEGGGEIALIRDPLGAGFTIYQGSALAGALTGGAGGRLGHHLFVSDAAAVMPFYGALFGWGFEGGNPARIARRGMTETVAHLHEVPDPAVRGKEQYWAISFGVAEAAAAAVLRDHNLPSGHAVSLPEGEALFVQDPDGAALLLVDVAEWVSKPLPMTDPRWKSAVGWVLFGAAVLMGWAWLLVLVLCGLIFVGLTDRTVWLFTYVPRSGYPVLYWGILAAYGALIIATLGRAI